MRVVQIDRLDDLENNGVFQTAMILVDSGQVVNDRELAAKLTASNDFGIQYKIRNSSDRLCKDLQQLMMAQKNGGADRVGD